MKTLFYFFIFSLWSITVMSCSKGAGFEGPNNSDDSDKTEKLEQVEGTRVAIRPLPIAEYQQHFDDMKFCLANVDMTYEGGEFGKFCNVAFPEYYVGWEEGKMDTNPETNEIVKIIK